MEVETVDEQRLSPRAVAGYVGVVAAFVALTLLPGLFSVPYLRALKTALLVVMLVQVLRLATAVPTTLRRPRDPPELPAGVELPSVSVVIPAYNEASVLPDTIEACRALDYPAEKLEVVICYEADCSDATPEIAEAAAAEDPRFVAVERDEPGGGKAKAANYAMAHATGDVIASIDADHQFESDAVRRAVRWFVADPETWCVKGRCFGRNPTDSVVSLYATVDRHIIEKGELFAREVFHGFTMFGGGQAFFRREVFDRLGGFDEEVLVEDIDMSARLHAAGKRIRVDPGVVTYEEQPTTLRAWWSQRKRWARGWLQVSVRYLGSLLRSSRPSLTAKADAAHTFAYNLMLPFLVIGLPFPLLDALYTRTSAYIPHSEPMWLLLGAFPPLVAFCVFLRDRRDGLSHRRREYLAALTIGPYMLCNLAVYVVAFLEEFVVRRPAVYVTTTRARDET